MPPYVLAHGIDVVDLTAFAAQLSQPGTQFLRVLSRRERLRANRYSGFRFAEHVAGRWAIKEAVIKAFSQALFGQPPIIAAEEVNFAEIEVVADAFGRIKVQLHGEFAAAITAALGEDLQWFASISHDGAVCIGSVILCRSHTARTIEAPSEVTND
ncbi:holo-ACP synthase [Corynebacterium choanae]|uniref:Holo-[acyl-carrier-protein] synthase n=1 Tax=Corynebacterium choanae TaxID=1862358 RepID=A0A3G6JDD2_9CORY|nr:holo-ACP synthase [Corynebacterium choanae]AZA14164.1 Holo-[acyl-carrier-protein] synthase [Corynebacterium choanae]